MSPGVSGENINKLAIVLNNGKLIYFTEDLFKNDSPD